MRFDPSKGHAALRRGRYSQLGAEYFLTLCTDDRQQGLTTQPLAKAIMDEIHAMVTDETWYVRCAVIMPDHLHLLVILGDHLSLGKAVQRLKAKTAAKLRTSGISWERGFLTESYGSKTTVWRYSDTSTSTLIARTWCPWSKSGLTISVAKKTGVGSATCSRSSVLLPRGCCRSLFTGDYRSDCASDRL